MKKQVIVDPNSRVIVAGDFDKEVVTEKYKILFNTKTGLEVLTGINGNPDPFILERPSMIDIGIMGHCENRCSFCYQGDNQQPNMTFDNFKKIIDEMKDHVNQVALGGRGDPNKHENFEDIVRYARENNVVPNYTTSGLHLTQMEIGITKEYCGACAISDYKTQATTDAINNMILAGVKTNIHKIFSSESSNECISMIVGTYPWHDRFINIDGLNAVVFLLFKPQGRGKKLTSLKPSKDQLERFSESIQNPNCNFKVGMDSCLINEITNVRPLTKQEELMADTCEGARMSCYISPDMKFLPCSFGSHEKYGIPIKDSIKEVWDNGESFLKFRNVLKTTPNVCPYHVIGF